MRIPIGIQKKKRSVSYLGDTRQFCKLEKNERRRPPFTKCRSHSCLATSAEQESASSEQMVEMAVHTEALCSSLSKRDRREVCKARRSALGVHETGSTSKMLSVDHSHSSNLYE